MTDVPAGQDDSLLRPNRTDIPLTDIPAHPAPYLARVRTPRTPTPTLDAVMSQHPPGFPRHTRNPDLWNVR